MKRITSFIILFVALICVYLFIPILKEGKFNINPFKAEESKIITENKDKNDSLEKKTKTINNIEKKAKEFIGDNKDDVALIYYDLKTDKGVVLNGDKSFVAASTIKVPMNMLLYDMANKKQIDIEKQVQYVKEYDYAEGTGKLNEDDLKKPISLNTLSKLSIENSDNIATNMIKRTIGEEKLHSYYDKILGHKFDSKNNIITANDLVKFLKILYNNPEHNKYYDVLIDYMKNTEFHDRMDKYIPKEIVAHKIGSYECYINDAGIVYTKDPYILIVFTNEVKNADDFIARLSKIVYDEVVGKIK